MQAHDQAGWSAEIHCKLREWQIAQVAYVPDAGHTTLIDLCLADAKLTTVGLTTEEEGVALLAGAWLGGARGALLMQSSGIGNCVNMFSLTANCRMPLLLLVTMRGQWGEFNPWQVPMGQNAESLLRLSGFLVFSVERAEEVAETVAAAARMAFEGPQAVAVLLSQRLLGAKSFANE